MCTFLRKGQTLVYLAQPSMAQNRWFQLLLPRLRRYPPRPIAVPENQRNTTCHFKVNRVRESLDTRLRDFIEYQVPLEYVHTHLYIYICIYLYIYIFTYAHCFMLFFCLHFAWSSSGKKTNLSSPDWDWGIAQTWWEDFEGTAYRSTQSEAAHLWF